MLKSLIDLIFPPLCHCCREFIPDAGAVHLCHACMKTTEEIHSPLCTICGVPFLTDGRVDHPCGRCLSGSSSYESARAAFTYEGAVRDLIQRLKYDGRVQARRPLSLLTAEHLALFAAETSPDLLVPVPLHARRIRQRGFNQAILISEILSEEWRIPLERRLLRRTRWTEPQVNLAAGERAANVRGAFALAEPKRVKGARVMLVDDVLTTGSTVNECARVLKKGGAAAVYVVTVARVPADIH